MKKIALLGATGSIGRQALEVAREFNDEIEIVAMSAHTSEEGLAELASEFKPGFLALSGCAGEKLEPLLTYKPTLFTGADALSSLVMECGADLVILAVLGIAALPVFEVCLDGGIAVGLANKEAIVCGGDVIRQKMDATKTPVLPVDSEHMAVFQCLGDSYDITHLSKIWLTASGGPFLKLSKEEIQNATPAQALKHPNWTMGRKISVDSASLANKGLEVIEAHFLYKVAGEDIKVVIQPQSLIHSMVEFKDSSVLAQFSPVDMRLPLQKTMLYPKMCKFNLNKPLDFTKLGKIDFIEPDSERFPCLPLAYSAIEEGTTAVYNIANEEAVDYFLGEMISFGGISVVLERCMEKFANESQHSVEEIMELDKRVRAYVKTLV